MLGAGGWTKKLTQRKGREGVREKGSEEVRDGGDGEGGRE